VGLTVSERLPVPRFEADGRAPPRLTERRGRLLVIGGGALLVALVASSLANATRVGLRCIDGQLVPVRGSWMPAGEEPLEDPSLPPLPVPAAACEDEDLDGPSALRARHREIAQSRVDAAVRREDARGLPPSTIDAAMAELPPGADEEARAQRRAMLQSIVDVKVEQARQSQQDAVRWIEQARQAGVDPGHLRAAERILGLPVPATEAPAPTAEDDEPSEAPPEATPGRASSLPRSL